MSVKACNRQKADLIFVNGSVYTVDEKRSWAEAVAVKGDKILAVGKNQDIRELMDEDTRVVDLEGKMVLPGFIDAHCHPMLAAYFKSGILMNVTMSVENVLQLVKKFIEENPQLDVYFGQGYSEWMFDGNGPNKKFLDDLCSDKPILLLGAGGHSGWCNSKALEMAGITKDTPDPEPGAQFYRRDALGNPTGNLVEDGPIFAVLNVLKAFQPEAVERAFQRVMWEYAAAGVTSLLDAGNFDAMEQAGWAMVEKMEKGRLLTTRIQSCGMVSSAQVGNIIDEILKARNIYDSDFFRVGYLKVVNDGTFEARSASLLEPYCEDGAMIHPFLNQEALTALMLEAAEAGLDIGIHAIGDRTIQESLNAAGAVRRAGFEDCRITNIHTMLVRPEDMEKFYKYNVMVNTTPVWHHENKDKERIIGSQRANRNYQMNTLYKQGVRLTFGSDFPADEYGKEPLRGIEMGVTRQTYGKPEEPVLLPLSERLTVAKMIEGYTINAAYQMRMEDKIGSVESGKYADLVVLRENLFEIDPHDIHKVPVIMTVLGGEVTYSADESKG